MHGVKRPKIETNERKTPAIVNKQAKALLDAPALATLKSHSHRAVLLRPAPRKGRTSVCPERHGIKHPRIHDKGGKLRYLPQHPVAAERIHAYLDASGHYLESDKAPLFRPLRGPKTGGGISAEGIYALVGAYAKSADIKVAGLGVHGLRATAATYAPEHKADIAKVQAWLGHANISTTKI